MMLYKKIKYFFLQFQTFKKKKKKAKLSDQFGQGCNSLKETVLPSRLLFSGVCFLICSETFYLLHNPFWSLDTSRW